MPAIMTGKTGNVVSYKDPVSGVKVLNAFPYFRHFASHLVSKDEGRNHGPPHYFTYIGATQTT
jgi:hypothetical protein